MSATRRPRGEALQLTRLPRGVHALQREEILNNQRQRLRQAMIEAVSDVGYQTMGIRLLARLAGVSPNAVYDSYRNKEECFLDTHDAIVAAGTARLQAAADAAGEDWHARLRAGVGAFIEAVLEAPKAAYLVLVETAAVGAPALEHQQQALEDHERLIRQAFDRAPHGDAVSDATIVGLVAGIRSIVYHHVSAGHAEHLRTLVDPIYEWMVSYDSAASAALGPAPALSRRRRPKLPAVPRAREEIAARSLGHRERIMRAVAAIVCEQSYAGLSMPAITARAGVSNQTFYEHFGNKHEAFVACYDRVSRRALGATMAAYQAADGWPAGVHASLHTLLSFVAAEPEFARLGLFEVLAAGPAARRRAEDRVEAFATTLEPGYSLAGDRPPRIVGSLVAGGVMGIIQRYVLNDGAERMLELSPHLAYFALAPFVGGEEAAAEALRPPA